MILNCPVCGIRWSSIPSEMKIRLMKSKNGKIYCSRICFIEALRTGNLQKKKPLR
jgi:hypothetical protein